MMKKLGLSVAAVALVVACSGNPSGLVDSGEGNLSQPPVGTDLMTVNGVAVSVDAYFDPENPPWTDPDNPGWIVMSLRVRNLTSVTVEILWRMTPGCHFWRRAYSAAEPGGEPAWDQTRYEGRPCLLYRPITRVPPGSDVAGPEVRAAVMEVLGDSLPEGDYHFTLTVAPSGKMAELFAGTFTLTRAGG
jgi:hypothetical protein